MALYDSDSEDEVNPGPGKPLPAVISAPPVLNIAPEPVKGWFSCNYFRKIEFFQKFRKMMVLKMLL